MVDQIRLSTLGPGGRAPEVLLVAPPPLVSVAGWAQRDPHAYEGFEAMWRDAQETSRAFTRQYARAARQRGVAFLDAGAFVVSSDVDGIHWGPEGHAAFGRAVAVELQGLPR